MLIFFRLEENDPHTMSVIWRDNADHTNEKKSNESLGELAIPKGETYGEPLESSSFISTESATKLGV